MQKNDATGWYANVSKNKSGQAEELNLGFLTFRPGSARFVEQKLVERCHNAFELAKTAGRLHGPLKSQAEAESLLGISTSAAAPPPAPVEDLPPVAVPVVEDLPPVADDDIVDAPPASSEGPAEDKKPKKLHRR